MVGICTRKVGLVGIFLRTRLQAPTKSSLLRVIPDSLIYPWLDLFVPDQMAPLGRCFPRISRATAFNHSHQFCISFLSNSLLALYIYECVLVPISPGPHFQYLSNSAIHLSVPSVYAEIYSVQSIQEHFCDHTNLAC